MAQLDSNIFLNQQGVDFEKIGQGFERGMRLGEMSRQRKIQDMELQKQQDIKDSYRAGMVENPDGSSSFVPSVFAKNLASKGWVKESIELPAQYQAQQAQIAENQQKINEAAANKYYGHILKAKELGGSPEAKKLWEDAYDGSLAMGADLSKVPREFDPKNVELIADSLLPYKTKAEEDRKNKETDLKLKEFALDTRLKMAQIAKINAEVSKEKNTGPKISEGQKTYDKEFAKDANDWTSDGRTQAISDVAALRSVVARLKDGKGTTGGATGIFGDRITDSEVLKNRAIVQKAAMPLIKRFLPGAISDSDREQVINTLWNESDSTQNNIDRIEEFANNADSRIQSMDSKTSFFQEAGGTLYGYKANASGSVKKEDMPSPPKTIEPQDQEAWAWAQKNKNDPRSQQIIQKVKGKYGL